MAPGRDSFDGVDEFAPIGGGGWSIVSFREFQLLTVVLETTKRSLSKEMTAQ